jgi:CRISPR-associated protein Cmr2
MPHLLNISIGPVQEFIASARRCQDLWYGSWLLSELSKAAAGGIVGALGSGDANQEALIFPGIAANALRPGSEASVANKLLVRVQKGGADSVRAIAEAGRKAMYARLDELARDVLGRIKQSFDRERASAQITDLMEYQWVAVEYQDAAYDSARKEVERLLNAEKNTKAWSQPSWSQAGLRKSSLDGVRESVLPEAAFDAVRAARGNARIQAAEELYAGYRVRPAERLCGVGLLKRWGTDIAPRGQQPSTFHSTGHLAAGPILERLDQLPPEELAHAISAIRELREFVDAVPPERIRVLGPKTAVLGDLDGSLLFESRLADLILDEDRRKEARKVLRGFLDQYADISEPCPYYAVLLADGDRMGEAISAQTTFTEHRKLSYALDEFARGVDQIVREHRGSLVYAGGDDVLAFLPLHRALDCAEALRKSFQQALIDFPPQPTLSVGLAISHFLEDMADALELARKAESLAKQGTDGKGLRNALAIVLAKRGGAPVQAVGRWDEGILERLKEGLAWEEAGWLSHKLPFEWVTLARLGEGSSDPGLLELIRRDARRILKRKQNQGGSEQAGVTVRTALEARLVNMKSAAELRTLSNELLIAKELARATAQSKPKETRP